MEILYNLPATNQAPTENTEQHARQAMSEAVETGSEKLHPLLKLKWDEI